LNNFNQNNNVAQINLCSCTKISIMQLFHEMKQKFPKVPDHIIQKLVTDNCHNKQACFDQIDSIISLSKQSTIYPTKNIHNKSKININNNYNIEKQHPGRYPFDEIKKCSDNRKMKQASEKFEKDYCSIEKDAKKNSFDKKRYNILRQAPDPPETSSLSLISKVEPIVKNFSKQESIQQEVHHNLTIDSAARKVNDSLNVQLNLTVSPIVSESKKIASLPPQPPVRLTSHLKVKPEAPFSSLLHGSPTSHGSEGALISSCGQRSFTKLNFTLRPPSSIMPSPNTPIEIHAGPQSLTYASTSFNAEQGYQRQLKITVADNTDGVTHENRISKNYNKRIPDINQIDTTVKIEGNCVMKEKKASPIRIITNSGQTNFSERDVLENGKVLGTEK
jgi:TAK1-binding protein 2